MESEAIDWEQDIPLNTHEVYRSLVRSLKRTDGFALVFVRCFPVQGDQIITDVRADLPSKTIEVLELQKSINNLYDIVDELPNRDQINVLFIKGLEYSIFAYEDQEMKDINLRSQSSVYSGNWKGVPKIFNHLNLNRERFRDNFSICFVFLVRDFLLDYFIRRAPDFFDWRSNIFEIPTDSKIIEKLFLKDTEWEIYTNFSQQQREEKMKQIQALLDENPQSPDQKARLLREYGRLLSTDNKNRMYEEAMAYFHEALTLKPDFYEAWRSKGNVLRDLGRYQEAIRFFDKALEINPNFYEAWRSRGNVLAILERNEEAITSYDMALQINPNNYEAWVNRGNILVRLGRSEEAIASYDKALQIQPDNYTAWLTLGNLLDIVGRYEKAISSYKMALENRPRNNDKRYELDMAINIVFQCNLPPRIYSKFIGRENEIKKLMEFLSPTDRTPYIKIAGIGGMGKTALAIEAAYRCLEAKLDDNQDPQIPKFEKIIFISAQDSFLLPDGINTCESSIHTLGDISRAISKALGDYSTMSVSPEAQSKLIIEALKSKGQILIIVDNLETLENDQEILAFLAHLPNNVKSILTSRKLSDGMYVPIKLGALSDKECLELLQQSIQKANISMNEQDKRSLCVASGGIPLAIIYSVGSLYLGSSLRDILDGLASESDVAKFCFQKTFEKLEINSTKLLFALSLFPSGVHKEALLKVSGMEKELETSVTRDLEKLEQVSLIHCQEGRYKILPLTRGYVRLKLFEHPTYEKDIRSRWKNWYLSRTENHGGDDWGNWHQDYDVIESEWANLLELLRWYESKNEYWTVWKLWTRLNKIAYLYGRWTERIYWLNYLIRELEKNNKLKELVEVMSSKAWTMIQMESEENLNEAKEILERAWLLRSNAPEISYIIATNLAVLNIRKEQFDESDIWFNKAKESIEEIKLINNKDNKNAISRGEIRINYYLGEKEHRLGNYEQAKKYFQNVQDNASNINWLRLVSASKELLADIAIRNIKIIEAEQLLQEGMPIAERNKDVRRLAFYLRSWARLERLKGDFEVSLTYASKSLDLFEKLKMDKKAQSVRDFISELEILQTST